MLNNYIHFYQKKNEIFENDYFFIASFLHPKYKKFSAAALDQKKISKKSRRFYSDKGKGL